MVVITSMTVVITSVTVLDNPTAFLNPFQFEISCQCLVPLKDDMIIAFIHSHFTCVFKILMRFGAYWQLQFVVKN